MTDKFRKLIELLKQLPGVGEKSATRYALSFLNKDSNYLLELSEILQSMATENWKCKKCFNISAAGDLCNICIDENRHSDTICVVENIADLIAIENTGEFSGKYHVLEKLINPLNGVFPQDTTINELIERIKTEKITEIILALPATTEGDTTAEYIKQILANSNIKITKLARGVPVGNSLENIDNLTLSKSIKNRMPF